MDGRKSYYYEVINSLKFAEYNNALLRIFPRIKFEEIDKLIQSKEDVNPGR